MSPEAEVIDICASRRQRVLMLSWEYPPVLVGGLGRHVHALATSLAAAG
ncbi:glycogen/starch synthase, partial [Micromonospora sp. NPDC049559]